MVFEISDSSFVLAAVESAMMRRNNRAVCLLYILVVPAFITVTGPDSERFSSDGWDMLRPCASTCDLFLVQHAAELLARHHKLVVDRLSLSTCTLLQHAAQHKNMQSWCCSLPPRASYFTFVRWIKVAKCCTGHSWSSPFFRCFRGCLACDVPRTATLSLRASLRCDAAKHHHVRDARSW